MYVLLVQHVHMIYGQVDIYYMCVSYIELLHNSSRVIHFSSECQSLCDHSDIISHESLGHHCSQLHVHVHMHTYIMQHGTSVNVVTACGMWLAVNYGTCNKVGLLSSSSHITDMLHDHHLQMYGMFP